MRANGAAGAGVKGPKGVQVIELGSANEDGYMGTLRPFARAAGGTLQ